MSTRPAPPLTLEAYLAIEEKSEYRSEFIDGVMYAMAGGTADHAAIALSTARRLAEQLRGTPCRAAVADLRIHIAEFGVLTYPDIVVRCGTERFLGNRRDTITDATLIVEVLSPSTKNYDRGEKFEYYRSLTSFAEYLLLAQDRMKAEHHVRMQDGSWALREFSAPTDPIELKSINCRLVLQDLYENVSFAAETES